MFSGTRPRMMGMEPRSPERIRVHELRKYSDTVGAPVENDEVVAVVVPSWVSLIVHHPWYMLERAGSDRMHDFLLCRL